MDENPYQSPSFGGMETEGMELTTLEAIVWFPFIVVLCSFVLSPIEVSIDWFYGRKTAGQAGLVWAWAIHSYGIILCEMIILS